MEFNYYKTLSNSLSSTIFGHDGDSLPKSGISLRDYDGDWNRFIASRIDACSKSESFDPAASTSIYEIGCAAFNAFLQANVTGPPLTWNSAKLTFPERLFEGTDTSVDGLQKRLLQHLSIDGESVYQLIPHIELFSLAKCIFNHHILGQTMDQILARLRVNFWHQRLLSAISPSLQESIYSDIDLLEQSILIDESVSKGNSAAQFLIERANIQLYHGFEVKAREDLIHAAKERSFEFVLTGRLGKRTKYQEKELSQLVVLAVSQENDESEDLEKITGSGLAPKQDEKSGPEPQAMKLNDDTLLESIAFPPQDSTNPGVIIDETLPPSLNALDPGNQPLLHPLDAIILLATATSITSTSPVDGLSREVTLPYAERVLAGGSSNWQVYTQALLVRSRIEGYKSRTIERGVLQLQAVVDQVIAEISGSTDAKGQPNENSRTTKFLSHVKDTETAPVSERLLYIHQLAPPPRWKLEAELADRWVSLGLLRTALEIYERLQMWAEVALCYAANNREGEARNIIRLQLYNLVPATSVEESWLVEEGVDDDEEEELRVERDPLPVDAPRLFCILGDIDKSVAAYERAWEVSGQRYARAQRSLGQYYFAAGDLQKADKAYAKSLKVNPQNHSIWFALGCVRLQRDDWGGAADAFGRAVQLEDSDAESWSNLAVALLKLSPEIAMSIPNGSEGTPQALNGHARLDDEDESTEETATDAQKHIQGAFVALKRAAALKGESYKIWQNLLNVAVRLSPPPYVDLVVAQARLIELLGKSEGENCIDVEVVEGLVAHVIASSDEIEEPNSSQKKDAPRTRRGLTKMILDLINKQITPLITSSRRLWLVIAKLNLHLRKASMALSAYEKAWRVTLNQPGWDAGAGASGAVRTWEEVRDSTIDLVDAYENLGENTNTSGLGAGEVIAKDWKFKARSALKAVIARSKAGWEDDPGYHALTSRLQELKGT